MLEPISYDQCMAVEANDAGLRVSAERLTRNSFRDAAAVERRASQVLRGLVRPFAEQAAGKGIQTSLLSLLWRKEAQLSSKVEKEN